MKYADLKSNLLFFSVHLSVLVWSILGAGWAFSSTHISAGSRRHKGRLAESTGESTTTASASSIHSLWLDWDVKQPHSEMTWVNWGFSSLRSVRPRLESPNHLQESQSIRLMCSQRAAALTQPLPCPPAPGTLSMEQHPAAGLISTPESCGSWNFSSTYHNTKLRINENNISG